MFSLHNALSGLTLYVWHTKEKKDMGTKTAAITSQLFHAAVVVFQINSLEGVAVGLCYSSLCADVLRRADGTCHHDACAWLPVRLKWIPQHRVILVTVFPRFSEKAILQSDAITIWKWEIAMSYRNTFCPSPQDFDFEMWALWYSCHLLVWCSLYCPGYSLDLQILMYVVLVFQGTQFTLLRIMCKYKVLVKSFKKVLSKILPSNSSSYRYGITKWAESW